MKNKLLSIVLLLLLSMFAVCASCEEVADATLPTFAWERNGTEHWRQLPSGEKADLGAHNIVETICTVCGSEIYLFDDGSADVSDYNEHEDLIRYTSFDSDGNVSNAIVYTYEYDEEGNKLLSQEFSGDVLVSEISYAVGPDGEQLPVEQVTYYDDDTWSINEYDAFGNMVHGAAYDADGNVQYEEFTEYKLNTDGEYYEFSKVGLFAEGDIFYDEYNEYGDTTLTHNTDANGNVWASEVYEYEYKDHVKLWRKHFSSGKLVTISYYAENGMTAREIEYFEGNSRMETEYNEHGDPVSIISYAADDQVESHMTYEYEYAEDLTMLISRAYTDGKLVIQTEYTVNEDGSSYAGKETVYEADGSCIVLIFDENDEIISETAYDANGNVI